MATGLDQPTRRRGTNAVPGLFRAAVAADLALRFLLKTRPYETTPGDADAEFEQAVKDFGAVLAKPGPKPKHRLRQLVQAVYPAVSEAHDDLPIRICYFDGINTNLDRDLEIFLALARAYQRRKKHPRAYPDYFD